MKKRILSIRKSDTIIYCPQYKLFGLWWVYYQDPWGGRVEFYTLGRAREYINRVTVTEKIIKVYEV